MLRSSKATSQASKLSKAINIGSPRKSGSRTSTATSQASKLSKASKQRGLPASASGEGLRQAPPPRIPHERTGPHGCGAKASVSGICVRCVCVLILQYICVLNSIHVSAYDCRCVRNVCVSAICVSSCCTIYMSACESVPGGRVARVGIAHRASAR